MILYLYFEIHINNCFTHTNALILFCDVYKLNILIMQNFLYKFTVYMFRSTIGKSFWQKWQLNHTCKEAIYRQVIIFHLYFVLKFFIIFNQYNLTYSTYNKEYLIWNVYLNTKLYHRTFHKGSSRFSQSDCCNSCRSFQCCINFATYKLQHTNVDRNRMRSIKWRASPITNRTWLL